MNVLIVHAHYEQESFSSALMHCAVDVFESGGHEVRVSDLYKMNWNPVASASDFGEREHSEYCVYALEQRKACQAGTIARDIAGEIEKVKWCDLLIFNFPMFWCSAPAILKGWIDRVFVSGLFYGGTRFYDRGGMTGKRAMVTLTLGGRDHMFGKDAIHGELDVMLRHLVRGTLGYCGFEVLKPFAAYHVPYISDEERGVILDDYRIALRDIAARQSVDFPKLSDFDEAMRPLRPSV
ncbi:NAD(P)H-dependent oxidoreductase [Thauera sp. SDU_THAU2]|uniref:NAD(P)H-dependent oxidoreductase n=1 Tax=Thauera sp. SDU_THAU2 TaxID=3136633 RepID=UPI00311E6A08